VPYLWTLYCSLLHLDLYYFVLKPQSKIWCSRFLYKYVCVYRYIYNRYAHQCMRYCPLHLERHFFHLKSQLMFWFSRSRVPRSAHSHITTQPNLLRGRFTTADSDFTDAYMGDFDNKNLCKNPTLTGENPITGCVVK